MSRFIACIVMLALSVAGARAGEKAVSPLWVGPAFSGTWFNPDRSGEGWVLQVLDNGTALLLWFTYPPASAGGVQAWIYADSGVVDGDRIRFASAITTRGPRFGPAFDPSQVQRVPWGTVEFRFTGCNDGEVTYAGPSAWGSATRRIVRLTEYAELRCGGKQRLTSTGSRAMEGLKQRSALWFDPAHDGEGWALEELPDGRAQVFWFTYDEAGNQAWTMGATDVTGERIAFSDMRRPVGTRFGDALDPARVARTPWGSLELSFSSCDAASLVYASSDANFGSGSLSPVRLNRLAGSVCLQQKPAVPTGGTWSAGTPMASPQSEVATATLGSRTCVAGGFIAQRDFQCYDAAANTWTMMPPLPIGRDHAEAVAYGGDFYFTGGNGDAGDTAGWRFRFAENRWEAVTELPYTGYSGAAMLDGFAYFGSPGAMVQYNPRTRTKRLIPGDGRAGRDHSQVVAFQGEIWVLGGRGGAGSGSNNVVSIFDPASETWRAGPNMPSRRSGFAAAASASHLFVAGGELLDVSAVVASVEAIAGGDTGWTPLAPMPAPVHGVGAAIHGNAFYLLGGSRQAATAVNAGDVQIYRFGP